MCGIFGFIGKQKKAAELVLNGLKRLEYRGYDSWGVAVKNHKKDTLLIKKRTGKIGKARISDLPMSTMSFGHTRWATHGGVTQRNAHPHLDCSKKIALVHNGIIENYEQLRKNLLTKGHNLVSETDSEVATHLIEEKNKTLPFPEAVRQSFLKFEGLNAIIAMDAESDVLVAARYGSPLVIGFAKHEYYIASDASALLPHTKNVCFLDEGEIAIIKADKIVVKDIATGKRKKIKTQRLRWSIKQIDKGKYSHFMLKEIHQQPDLISEITSSNTSLVNNHAQRIDKAFGTYLVGCGSASYACIAGTYLFSKIAKRHLNWAVGSEFSYHLDFLTPESLVIAVSQSGETIDILEAVKKAKSKGAKILALVNVLGSSLYREADYKMLIGVGPEKAVATTKAFTGKLAHLVLLAYAITGQNKKGKSVLSKAAHASKKVLLPKSVSNIKKLAKKIKNKRHIYVIGRGLSYPASLETALKIKEISYIHAEGFAAGELKHGVIALVEKGTPCISFLPSDETYGANLAGAMEMKARGGYIIGISYKPHEVFDYYINVEDADEATIIPNVIVSQVLAYELTISRNLDPDMPRNLAKSVTVK